MSPVAPGPVSVLIPAYEEAENLAVLLPRLRSELVRLGYAAEVIVVDTAVPRDGTAAVCAANGAACLRRRGGNSYGDAIRTGIAATRGARVVVMDADGSHDPAYLGAMLAAAATHEVVIGSRYAPGGSTDNSALLVAMSRLVNAAFRLVLPLGVRDLSNSFRVYEGGLLRALRLECDDFDLVEEILVRLALGRPDLRVKEVPIRFMKRLGGRTKRRLLAFIASYAGSMLRFYRMTRSLRRRPPAS